MCFCCCCYFQNSVLEKLNSFLVCIRHPVLIASCLIRRAVLFHPFISFFLTFSVILSSCSFWSVISAFMSTAMFLRLVSMLSTACRLSSISDSLSSPWILYHPVTLNCNQTSYETYLVMNLPCLFLPLFQFLWFFVESAVPSSDFHMPSSSTTWPWPLHSMAGYKPQHNTTFLLFLLKTALQHPVTSSRATRIYHSSDPSFSGLSLLVSSHC